MNIFTEGIEHFLKAVVHESKANRPADIQPFITISRQAGAGGHSLAEEILRQMKAARQVYLFQGWRLFDHQLIKMTASNPKLKIHARFWQEREIRSEIEDIFTRLIANTSPQSEVLKEMFGLMRALAASGKVILVGRGGACLTRDIPGGVHVRLVAPLPVRIQRMRRLLNVDELQAARTVLEQDKARKALVRTCFSHEIEDPLLYDAIWNTEQTPLPVIAATILRLVEYKMRHHMAQAARIEDRVLQ